MHKTKKREADEKARRRPVSKLGRPSAEVIKNGGLFLSKDSFIDRFVDNNSWTGVVMDPGKYCKDSLS